MNKNFIFGIAAVKFGTAVIGYIEKGSWDWGGTKPETTDVEAEQVPDAPVLTLVQKNGQISPTFNLIQLDYENLHNVLGGELVGTSGNYTGWKAPTSLVDHRLRERSDDDHSERYYPGEPRRQVDLDRGVEGRVPAEGEQACRWWCSIRNQQHPC